MTQSPSREDLQQQQPHNQQTFPERHAEIVQRAPKHPTVKLWVYTILFSALVALLCGWYVTAYFSKFTTRVINETAADAGFILIGCSFALSGICYFWNFLDTKIVYRKYLGLMGFFFIVVHVYLSLFKVPFPLSQYLDEDHRVAFFAAVISLAIFVGMALISNRYAVRQLGGAHWRKLLRTGYAAYIIAIVHFALRKGPEWSTWFAKHKPALPPLSILVVIFAALVLALRFSLFVALLRKKSAPVSQA